LLTRGMRRVGVSRTQTQALRANPSSPTHIFMDDNTKFIVLRGNSGSGKSGVARAVRLAQGEPMAYIEQDCLRRIILKEKDIAGGLNIQLIKETVLFSLRNSYHVILEGLLLKKRYEGMFEELLKLHPSNNHFFYFDVSLEETLKRHQTKINKDEFGEVEMRDWYKETDLLHCAEEEIIPESNSLEESVKQILSSAGLK
jgi:predicted kinase